MTIKIMEDTDTDFVTNVNNEVGIGDIFSRDKYKGK